MPFPPVRLEKQKLILIIGIALALAAVLMIKVYLDQQRRSAEEVAKRRFEKIQANQSSILIAKKDIPRGGAIDPDSLEIKIIPNQFVQPGAVTSLDRVSGMVVMAPISKGEQITLNKLSYQRAGDLAAATPAGKRAITIAADNITSLAGMIRAGDYVDVIAIVPVPIQTADGKTTAQMATFSLFQNVLILAVGQQTSAASTEEGDRYRREAKQEASSSLITIALSPQEANLTAFVQEQQGRIRLVLRSPTDAKIESVQPVSWETLFQYVMPQQPGGGVKAKEEPPVSGYVEVYHGLNKEKVPLYK